MCSHMGRSDAILANSSHYWINRSIEMSMLCRYVAIGTYSRFRRAIWSSDVCTNALKRHSVFNPWVHWKQRPMHVSANSAISLWNLKMHVFATCIDEWSRASAWFTANFTLAFVNGALVRPHACNYVYCDHSAQVLFLIWAIAIRKYW